MNMTDVLSQLYQEDPEVAKILDVYKETERIYRDALRAIGRIIIPTFESKSSAEIIVSFHPSQSLSTDSWSSSV